MRFLDHAVIVTGAAQGIGREIACAPNVLLVPTESPYKAAPGKLTYGRPALPRPATWQGSLRPGTA